MQDNHPDMKKAALIIIGNEVLSGRTKDANTPWIAERLNQEGIVLKEVRIIPDIEQAIIDAIHGLKDQVEYVFTTGGIGPTHDDITAQSVANAFGLELQLSDDAYQRLLNYYDSEDDITPARKKMAMIPVGAKLIDNAVSGAPGFIVENVHVMAGVPKIMQAMFDHIATGFEGGPPVLSNTVTCGLAESHVAPDLGDIQARYTDIDIGSYPHYRGGVLGLSVVLRGVDQSILEAATNDVVDMVKKLGGEPKAISLGASRGT